MPRPLGYHITWGTYGTRLHGDHRGTVERGQTDYGAPVLGSDAFRWEKERARLKFPPVYLTPEQRRFVEATVPDLCIRGHWTFHVVAGGLDHVHVLLTSEFDPETIRRLLKRWLGQAMSSRWLLTDGATWWAESGSIRWLMEPSYFKSVQGYVRRQRATLEPVF
jgi:hypothetical protein